MDIFDTIETEQGDIFDEIESGEPLTPKPVLEPLDMEGIPFDIDRFIEEEGVNLPLDQNVKRDFSDTFYPLVRPFYATPLTAAKAFNRGMSVFSTHLDVLSEYVEELTGFKSEGLFEQAARVYEDNAEYWQERADKVGVSFVDELLGEAVGGGIPGVGEFILNVPYFTLLGAAEASKEGGNEVMGALTEGGKRGLLGLIFRAIHPLKQYLRAPTMGTVFGLQAMSEGGDPKEIAKSFGTGALYSMASPGGRMGLNELKRNITSRTYLRQADLKLMEKIKEKPVEEIIKPEIKKEVKKEPEKAIRKKTGEIVLAEFAPEKDFRREPEAGVAEKIYRRSDIVQLLKEKLDIPIRTGRFRDKALGLFKIKPEVIRTLKANDIEVIAHEVGHALHKYLFPEAVTTKGLSGRPFSAFEKELLPLATKPKAGQDPTPEGFAEFIRLYITDVKKAQKLAPQFYEYFDKTLGEKSPESKEIFLDAREQYEGWIKQPALQRVLSQVSVGVDRVRKTTLDDIYTMTVDDLFPLRKIVQEMTEKKELPAHKDPYKLARLLRGWHGKADAFLRHSPFKFKTYRDFGKPLQAILKPIEKDLDKFRAYILSKRTIDLNRRGIETGILIKDAKEIVKTYNKQFSQAFKDLKEYQDATLLYLKDSGLIDTKTYVQIKNLNRDYVPLYRVMEEARGQGTGVGLQARQPIHRITGSWRDIQDPLESIIKNTYLYISLAEKNAVGKALVKLSKQKQGMGKYVEKIPTPVQSIKVSEQELSGIKKELEGILPENVISDLPLDFLTIFRPSAFVPKANVISVWENGKRNLYEVHPEIARTIQALDKESVSLLVKILSKPAAWLRAGATLTPEFMARNPIRDQVTAGVYSKYGYVPGVDLVRGIFSLVKKDRMYWEWKKAGGDHAMLVSLDRAYLQDKLGDVLQKYPVRNVIRHPMEMLRLLSELGEAGTRIGEFRKAHKGIGKEPAQEAGFAARDVTLDFAMMGAKTKAMNMITAFWNAQVQGTDKMVRAFKDDPVGTTIKTAAMITVPSIILTLINRQDERWKDIPQWQKDLFWIVMTEDTIWRIPKPFELGIIFGSVPERLVEYILDKDPDAFDEIWDSVIQGATPGVIPTAALPLLENWANKSVFFDRPIVSRGREELLPEYQYKPYTTETAKALGKIVGKLPVVKEIVPISPAKIENLVRGWTGGLGAYALQIMDASLRAVGVVKKGEVKPTKTLADIPFIKAFIVRFPTSNAASVNKFYKNYSKAKQIYKTAKVLIEKERKFDEGMELMLTENIERLESFNVAMGNIHKMINAVYIDPNLLGDEKREFVDILYMQMIGIATEGNKVFKLLKEIK